MDQMKDSINILAIGDIVGRPGRDLVRDRLPEIVDHYRIDVVIANGENAAGGMSITPETAQEILSWGADVITTGNHVWNSKEISLFIGQEPRLLRPANYPEGVPGKGYFILTAAGFRVCVINLMGRLLMNPIDCPFRKFDALHGALKGEADVFVVDFHAEATSE
jgi:metallophosphoesterase (TIGR00282 family)